MGLTRAFSDFGENATAKLGDPAAPLSVSEWIKGEPVEIEKGKIYVINFWTRFDWLNIAELQRNHPDISFVGITPEKAKEARDYVAKHSNEMEYPIALDTDWKTIGPYKVAYDVDLFPVLFVVNADSRVVWHGKPDDEDLPGVLQSLRDETFNLDAAILKLKTKQQREKRSFEFFLALENQGEAFEKLLDEESLDLGAIESCLSNTEALVRTAFGNEYSNAVPDNMFTLSEAYRSLSTRLNKPESKQQAKKAIIQLLNETSSIPAQDVRRDASIHFLNPNLDSYDPEFGLFLAQYAFKNLSESVHPTEKAYTLDALAKAFHQNGRTAEALHLQEQAVLLYPEDSRLRKQFMLYLDALAKEAADLVPAK